MCCKLRLFQFLLLFYCYSIAILLLFYCYSIAIVRGGSLFGLQDHCGMVVCPGAGHGRCGKVCAPSYRIGVDSRCAFDHGNHGVGTRMNKVCAKTNAKQGFMHQTHQLYETNISDISNISNKYQTNIKHVFESVGRVINGINGHCQGFSYPFFGDREWHCLRCADETCIAGFEAELSTSLTVVPWRTRDQGMKTRRFHRDFTEISQRFHTDTGSEVRSSCPTEMRKV